MDSRTLPDADKHEGERKRLKNRAPPTLKVMPPPPDLFVRRIPIPLLSPLLEGGEVEECKPENEDDSGTLEAVKGRMGTCVEKG
ncbi:hypothetical protein SUGI_0858300 [Cryptomeria japonica]|nr:hypothetical protein SUGI_0858300 [Cryptomeria japonica]